MNSTIVYIINICTELIIILILYLLNQRIDTISKEPKTYDSLSAANKRIGELIERNTELSEENTKLRTILDIRKMNKSLSSNYLGD